MQGNNVIAKILKAEGVDFLACFPANTLIDQAAREGIRPIISRQERAGVNIADGFSRVTNGRTIGVFAMQHGPGAENAYGGVAQAFADSVPILLLPGGHASDSIGVPPGFEAAQQYQGVEAVVHTAATVRIDRDPEGAAQAVNLGGTRNVIAACIAGGARKLVHVSSIHAYGPLHGTTLGADSPLASASRVPYGAAKAQAHAAVVAAARNRQLDGSLVCPSGILGPGDQRPTVVGGMLLAVAGGRLPCLVEGGYWWCDVRDVAAAIVSAVADGTSGAVYFTTGHYASVRELADLCSGALERDVRRPVLPRALAVAGLPFIQAYAALGRRPPLYSRNALDLLDDCPAAVDDASARRQLGYSPRPFADTVGDALAWFQARGMLA